MVIMCSDISFHDRNGLQDEPKKRKQYPPPLPRCTPLPEDHIPSSHSEKCIICFPQESSKHCKRTKSKEVFLCLEPSKECIPVCNENSRKRKRAKSRELRSGYVIKNCECERRNGLQDQCPRFECRGSPECWPPPATCPPSEFSLAKHLVAKHERNLKEQNELKEKIAKEKAKMRKHKEENKDDFCKKAKLKRTHSDEKNCVTLDGQLTTCPKKQKIDNIYDDCPPEKKKSCPNAEKHKEKHDYENICIEIPQHAEIIKCLLDKKKPYSHAEKHKEKHDYENICIEIPQHAEIMKCPPEEKSKKHEHKSKRPHSSEKICIAFDDKICPKKQKIDVCFVEYPVEKKKSYPRAEIKKEKHETAKSKQPHSPRTLVTLDGQVVKEKTYHKKEKEKNDCVKFCIDLPNDEAMSCPIFLPLEFCKSKHETHKSSACLRKPSECFKLQKISKECPYIDTKHSHSKSYKQSKKSKSAKSICFKLPKEYCKSLGKVKTEPYFCKIVKDVHHMKHRDAKPFFC